MHPLISLSPGSQFGVTVLCCWVHVKIKFSNGYSLEGYIDMYFVHPSNLLPCIITYLWLSHYKTVLFAFMIISCIHITSVPVTDQNLIYSFLPFPFLAVEHSLGARRCIYWLCSLCIRQPWGSPPILDLQVSKTSPSSVTWLWAE